MDSLLTFLDMYVRGSRFLKIQKSCSAVDDRHLLPMKGEVSAQYDYARHYRAHLPDRAHLPANRVRQVHAWRRSTEVRGQARSYIDMWNVMAPA
jgi:hypothetical protein